MRSGAGILLLQRGQPYSEFLQHNPETQGGVGLWELPGGSLDFGETPLQAVVLPDAAATLQQKHPTPNNTDTTRL